MKAAFRDFLLLLVLQSLNLGRGKNRRCCIQSIFGIHADFLRTVEGGFFLRKKPLSLVLSAYTNSENAIARAGSHCFLESNQVVLVIAHFQGFHIFKLVQAATGLDALHDVVLLHFRLREDQVDGRLVDGQNIA